MSFGTDITTSRRQGQLREELSEGSPSAQVRADEQKPQRRPSLRASQHQMTKPTGYRRSGKCGGGARIVQALLRGGLSGMRPGWAKGAGLRPRAKALEAPPDPTAPFRQRVPR